VTSGDRIKNNIQNDSIHGEQLKFREFKPERLKKQHD
jgi:hypothetical protein